MVQDVPASRTIGSWTGHVSDVANFFERTVSSFLPAADIAAAQIEKLHPIIPSVADGQAILTVALDKDLSECNAARVVKLSFRFTLPLQFPAEGAAAVERDQSMIELVAEVEISLSVPNDCMRDRGTKLFGKWHFDLKRRHSMAPALSDAMHLEFPSKVSLRT
jgi:hypothetical protein